MAPAHQSWIQSADPGDVSSMLGTPVHRSQKDWISFPKQAEQILWILSNARMDLACSVTVML